MRKSLEQILQENENLKSKVAKMKRELLMKRIEFQTEIDYRYRRQYLLNLLLPRTDMEDMTKTMFAYLIRMFPFRRAVLIVKKEKYRYSTEARFSGDEIVLNNLDEIETNLQSLINKCLKERKGFLISKIEADLASEINTDCETCMVYPISIGDDAHSICYFENDLEGSYSHKEFEIVEEIMQDVAYLILNCVEYSMLIKCQNSNIKNDNSRLYNRNYLLTVLEKQLLFSKATEQPFSLIYIKIISDDENHRKRVVKKMACYFNSLIRKVDTVFSYSENELIILINNADKKVAENVERRLENFDIISADIDEENLKIDFGIYCHSGRVLETNLEVIEKAKKR